MTLAILDYGMGNLRSVEKALAHVGVEAEVTSDSDRVRAAAGLVLPGVGAFPEAMRAVRARGLDELVRERVAAGVPTLGICLGMQLLFESSSEHGGAEGIGLLEGDVAAIGRNGLSRDPPISAAGRHRMPSPGGRWLAQGVHPSDAHPRPPGSASGADPSTDSDGPRLKLPQIGWNEVAWRRDSPLVSGLQDPSAFYHVHSFAPRPAEGQDVLGTAVYGDEFVSAVERAPVFGVQFHPEKSGLSGLRLLRSFAALARS